MSRITRKELKSDKFALEVEHTFTFFGEHRVQVVRYGTIALGVVVLVLAFLAWSRHQHSVRETALRQALQAQDAPVGDANPNAPVSFPNEETKQKETTRRFTDIVSQYSGSEEAQVAEYYLGAISVDQGKLAEAEKQFKTVADSGNRNYASLAKLSLAQIYFSNGNADAGEKTLRGLIDNPTDMVSREHATIALARGIMAKKPAEARKLLEPLRTVPGTVGQTAIALVGEIPAQ